MRAAEDRLWNHRRAVGLAAAVLLLAPVAGWLYLRKYGTLPDEPRVTRWFLRQSLDPNATQTANFVGDLASPIVAGTTVVVAVAIAWLRMGGRHAAVVALATLAVLLNAAVKHAFGLPNGPALFTGEPGGTYPSGHVAYVTATFGAIGWLGIVGRRLEVSLVCGLLILAMGPSRVLRAAHVPSDVLAGYALGAGWLLIVILATCAYQHRGRTTPLRR